MDRSTISHGACVRICTHISDPIVTYSSVHWTYHLKRRQCLLVDSQQNPMPIYSEVSPTTFNWAYSQESEFECETPPFRHVKCDWERERTEFVSLCCAFCYLLRLTACMIQLACPEHCLQAGTDALQSTQAEVVSNINWAYCLQWVLKVCLSWRAIVCYSPILLPDSCRSRGYKCAEILP